jgi:hypothetical protein
LSHIVLWCIVIVFTFCLRKQEKAMKREIEVFSYLQWGPLVLISDWSFGSDF